jgi:predicted phosphohydrolase
MKVFGISDLHLSATGDKPMDVFGAEWAGHAEKLEHNWRHAVGPDDLVLICGDLSWAMTLAEAQPDLDLIDGLPGVKYFIRGNHDFWFAGPSKVRAAVGSSMHLVRFGAASHGGVGICGVRAWIWPGHPEHDPEGDSKHWRRAVTRLGLSLDVLRSLAWEVAVAMFHYPPRGPSEETELSRMIRDAGVRYCVYGHVHGQNAAGAIDGEVDGVVYQCVSADQVGFSPSLLFERAG